MVRATRLYLPQLWVRNLLSRTTDISQNILGKIDKGLMNQWIQTIRVYGLDSKDRCHVGIEITIDWHMYSVQVAFWGETVSVKKTIFAEDNLAPELGNCIRVFNQAVIEECLRTEWRVSYPQHLDWERIDQELGFMPCSPLTWAGKIRKQSHSQEERAGENSHRFGMRRVQEDPAQWILEKEIEGDHLHITFSPELLKYQPEQVQDVLAFFRLLVRSFSHPNMNPPRDEDQ